MKKLMLNVNESWDLMKNGYVFIKRGRNEFIVKLDLINENRLAFLTIYQELNGYYVNDAIYKDIRIHYIVKDIKKIRNQFLYLVPVEYTTMKRLNEII